ncbi:Uncharacterised protein [uncultured archaeon]|nr:Uncharacterised protein [uncultured archaeon]
MPEPVQKPQTNATAFQRMLGKKDQFYAFVGKTYDESIIYVGKEPKKAFWIGATVAAIAFGTGVKVGNSNSSERMIEHAYSTVKLIHGQNLTLLTAMEDMKKDHAMLSQSVQEIKTAQVELRNDLNNARIQKSIEQGEQHVEQVRKEKRSKWLPWNWFR